MANVLIEESTMYEIGDAIREKTGKTAKIIPKNMPAEIRSIMGVGGGFVYPDGAFAPVTSFTDGKQYALVSLIGGVRRYINTTEYNQYTMNATEITISEDAGDYVIFSSTPVMFTAVASGNGFLLKNGNNYLYGTSSGGTALRVGTTQAVWTVDTSATGGFASGKYNAKEDANAVWLINNTGGYNWSIKYETAGSFGYDRDGRDNTYSTGFTPFVLYEYVAGEGEVNPIMDTSEGNLSSSKMLEGAIGFSNGRRVEGNIPSIQADTITPSTTAQEIPAGVYLAGKQTISAIQTEEKTVTANGTVTPSSGKYLTKVTVNVPTGSTLPEGAIAVRVTKGASESTQIGSGYSLSVTYGDDVDINDSLALDFVGTTQKLSSISDSTDFSVLEDKYIRSGSSMSSTTGKFYYIPVGATFTVGGSTMSKTLTCDKAQKVSIEKINL